MDCDPYELEFSYDDTVIEIEKTVTGYVLTTLKEGSSEVTVSVKDKEITSTFNVNVSGDIDRNNGVEVETFKRGEKVDAWYEGRFFNIGARANSSTAVPVSLENDGVHVTLWTKGDARILFGYNGTLDTSNGKKYAARVSIVTPSDFPQAGYVVTLGHKQTDEGSYKDVSKGTDAPVTVSGGSTSRAVLTGKGETNVLYYIFDENTTSNEFYMQFFSGSNAPDWKLGMDAELTVSKIEMIDLSADDGFATETIDAENVNGSNKSYQGTLFNFVTSGGDNLDTTAFQATSLLPYGSGVGLRWTTSRVWKKGITNEEVSDIGTNNVVQMKAEIQYKETDATKSYRVRIPVFVAGAASDAALVNKAYIDLSYGRTEASEVAVVSKTAGWTNTLVLFEVEIPANVNWDGRIILRVFNDDATTWEQGNKMLCTFYGVSIKEL